MDFLWTDGTTPTPGEPLQEDVHTEVCVIGGGMAEMMIAAGAIILLLCVVEWLYMAAVKRSSSRYLLGLMAPEREE